MNELSPIQVRILGCLVEKQATTPDQYPLSINSLRLACNQKTARDPVTAYSEGEVGHAVRELESLGLVREVWGARVARYEHLAGKVLDIQSKALALLCPLMLRGFQTPGELRTHAQRLFEFDDLDDVEYVLQRMAEHEPPLTCSLPRQPGQKEIRWAHLLAGKPQLPSRGESAPAHRTPDSASMAREEAADMVQRIEALEEAVASLQESMDRLNP